MKSVNWWPMRVGEIDIAYSMPVGRAEDEHIIWERYKLFIPGCHVLKEEQKILGYVISHPWVLNSPPPFNQLLDILPAEPDCYHIHDIAILPEHRGNNYAMSMVNWLLLNAADIGFSRASVVTTQDMESYWQRYGFQRVDNIDLSSYNDTYAIYMVNAFDIGSNTR